jgi:hypothetical protein
VVLFIVEDVTYNICDQRFMEFEVRRLSPETRVLRRTLGQLAREASLGPDRSLRLSHDTIVSVVYFRYQCLVIIEMAFINRDLPSLTLKSSQVKKI